MQLADQSIEDFMTRRGFHAMPEHEDTWAVPVSLVPAAYNLHARMAASADHGSAEEEEGRAELQMMVGPDADSSSPHDKQPCKPRQQV